MKLISSAVLIASASFLLAPALALAQENVKPISLQTGHSIVLSEPGLTRVAVGDGQIAGVLPIGTQQVVINGKAPGRTTVFVWDKHGRTTYEVEVVQQEVDNLANLIRQSINQTGVTVMSTGHTVVVGGTVDTIEQYGVITTVINQFTQPLKEAKDSVVNAVRVLHPLGSLTQEIKAMPGAGTVRVDPDGKGNVVVSGFVEDRALAEHILGHVRGLAAPYLSIDGKVVDRLETATTAQIDIKVNVLEVDDTAQHQLGNQLQSALFNPQSNTYTLGGPAFPVIEGLKPANTNTGRGLTVDTGFFRTYLLAPTLQALITEGHARTLSSPDLTTLPGTEADFLVGGQIPYIYSTGLNQTSVDFKDYGVKLKVTPTILPNGSIQAVIAPEISEIDQANAVIQNGFSIPALTTSKLSTTAVTRPGQSIVLGGMLRHLESRTIQKWPILGDLPILGKLFTSTNYQENKSNVVFVLTPTIINR
jgi:pilus assembly protein CpaC